MKIVLIRYEKRDDVLHEEYEHSLRFYFNLTYHFQNVIYFILFFFEINKNVNEGKNFEDALHVTTMKLCKSGI